MSGLPQVLQDAARQQATEVIFEAGKTPIMRRDGKSVPFGERWSERQLFDALEGVLEPEQLAELAVGNVVEFSLDIDGSRWTLLGEPSAEGVVVRGRLRTSLSLDVGAPMELPPLDPFVPDDDDVPQVPLQEGSRVTGEHWAAPMPPRDRLGASQGVAAAQTVAQGAPEWLMGNDDGRWASASVGSSGPGAAADMRELSHVPEDLPDLIEPDFSDPLEDAEEDEDSGSLAPLDLFEKGDKTISMRSQRETLEDLRGVRSGEFLRPFAAMAADLRPGCVCWIQGGGVAELLVEHLDGDYCYVDEDSASLTQAEALLLRDVKTVVIRREDPSAILGWILRRVEEGVRVVLETRARSASGARRVLLGVSHGQTADAWLAEVPTFWIAEIEGQWRCEGPLMRT